MKRKRLSRRRFIWIATCQGLDGGKLATLIVGNYEVSYGQLAAGGFYGGLTMATDGSRYMLCWSEAFQLGCAAIGVGSGDVSSSVFVIPNSQLVQSPHVAQGAAGWFVYSGFAASNNSAIALDNDAQAIGVPISVPATNAVATTNGFAVASTTDTRFPALRRRTLVSSSPRSPQAVGITWPGSPVIPD